MEKYVELCTNMISAIETGDVKLCDGEYMINDDVEIYNCPWCGKELVNYIALELRTEELVPQIEENTIVFEEGNDIPYGQDFSFLRGIPAGIRFKIATEKLVFDKVDNIRLIAPGYGEMDDYGNGAIYVNKKYIIRESD